MMTVADMAGAEAVMAGAGAGMAIRVELQSVLQGTIAAAAAAAAAAIGASTRSARRDDLVLAKYANRTQALSEAKILL